MSNVYHEFPTDKIVAVHWAGTPTLNCKQLADIGQPLPRPCAGNKYGIGAQITDIGGGVYRKLPYGPNIQAPFIGTWDTVNLNGPLCHGAAWGYGGLLNPYVDELGNVIAPTYTVADDPSVNVGRLILDVNSISFQSDNLPPADPDQPLARRTWRVPMCEGQVCVDLKRGLVTTEGGQLIRQPPEWSPVAVVVKQYTVTMEWSTPAYALDPTITQVGVAISHGIETAPSPSGPTFPDIIVDPPASAVTPIGDPAGGVATFTYDVLYGTYNDLFLRGQLTGANLWPGPDIYDPSVGGPATLWWLYYSTTTESWKSLSGSILLGSTGTEFMDDALGDFAHPSNNIGAFYTWEITTTTETVPYGSLPYSDPIPADR